MPALDTRVFIIIRLLVIAGLLALHILVDRLLLAQQPRPPATRPTPPRILGTNELQADIHFQATSSTHDHRWASSPNVSAKWPSWRHSA